MRGGQESEKRGRGEGEEGRVRGEGEEGERERGG